jgi:hypothetical protein
MLAFACAAAPGAAKQVQTAGLTTARCELGSLSPTDAKLEARLLTAASTRFENSLTRVTRRERAAAGSAFLTDLAAYIYGYPIVIVRRTILNFPRNQMVSIAKLADTSTVTVVAPNHDTLYSVGQIDLSDGPVVIHTPPTGGRYSVIQLLDAFTDVPAYLGAGAAARNGETAAIIPPGWQGQLPPGVEAIHVATKLVWLLGRTLVDSVADTPAATQLLSQYSVTPLAAYLGGTRTAPLILPDFPHRTPVEVPTGTAFFDELSADLAADPPPARDQCALRAFAAAGIGPGQTPSTDLAGIDAKALGAAAAAGHGALDQLVAGAEHEPSHSNNGWATTPPDTGKFATAYVDRAVVAVIGLGANTNSTALYLREDRDSADRPLTGRHVYVVHFKRGQLPPVRAFWSITLYDQRLLFYGNPLGRYSLGDRSRGLRYDHNGGLTIYVSHRPPAKGKLSNWLPAPAGPFSLYLRLYEPKPAVARGHWLAPPVVRAGR